MCFQVLFAQNKVIVEPIPRNVLQLAHIANNNGEDANVTSTEKDKEFVLSKIPYYLFKNLAPFQVKAVQFGIKNNGRILLADEMGLGKFSLLVTVSKVLAYLCHLLFLFISLSTF